MAGKCWGCEVGVAPIGATGEPVGTCWVCGVWGCFGHAERDAKSLKWHCYPSVATALASSAGLPDVESEAKFESVDDVRQRFPALMLDLPRGFMPNDALGLLQSRLTESPTGVDPTLLALALDLATFLLSAWPYDRFAEAPGPALPPVTVLPTTLVTLLGRA